MPEMHRNDMVVLSANVARWRAGTVGRVIDLYPGGAVLELPDGHDGERTVIDLAAMFLRLVED
jgi:hypothetical protein